MLLNLCVLTLLISPISYAFLNRVSTKRNYKLNNIKNPVFEGRRYTSYNIYKGKGAINIKVIAPTWSQLQGGNSFTLAKEGGLLFEFAPAGNAPREYDWSKKMSFLMDVTECGDLLYKVQDGVEFVHDPGALTASAGQVTKKMKWSVTPDNRGVFVSLAVNDKTNPQLSNASISIPITWGEYIVIDTIMRHCIPYFLGIDQLFAPPGTIHYGSKEEVIPPPPPVPVWKKIE